MKASMRTHTLTHTHAHTYTYTHTHRRACAQTHMYVCVYSLSQVAKFTLNLLRIQLVLKNYKNNTIKITINYSK